MAGGKAWLPPRWFIKTFWHLHRGIVRASRGGRGLWAPRPGKWGALRLTTTGRRSGQPRSVILGYYTDGPNLVTMAMNGWGAPEPAWWLNLQASPETTVELHDRTLAVRLRTVLLGVAGAEGWPVIHHALPRLCMQGSCVTHVNPTSTTRQRPLPTP